MQPRFRKQLMHLRGVGAELAVPIAAALLVLAALLLLGPFTYGSSTRWPL